MAPSSNDLYRQTTTLTNKTFKIVIARHFRSTLYSALVLPVLASVYLGIGQKFNQPNDKFGVGTPHAITSLPDALHNGLGGRDTVLLINNGPATSEVDRVFKSLEDTVHSAGANATRLPNEDEIGRICKASLRGTSTCFGAVVVNSSPSGSSTDDKQGWNYTIRADYGLGISFRVDKTDNDNAMYTIPLQNAVNAAILGKDASKIAKIQELPITSITDSEREAENLRQYQTSFINYLSVSFIIALIGVSYHLPGFIATEREAGLSQLIDAMMPVSKGWHRQLARLLSQYGAFALTYLPGWIISAVICRVLIWNNTNMGILIVHFILSGLAMTSMSLLGACFFRKAQLAGIVTAVVWLVLGIAAQVTARGSIGAVIVLSLLFTPSNFVYFIVYVARYERQGVGANLAHAANDEYWQLPGYVFWIFLILQASIYPFVAAFAERTLHGVTTGVRLNSAPVDGSGDAIRIDSMTKIYEPSFLRRIFAFVSPPRPRVVAVDRLSLRAKKGQILALLGANGSGKSTTLDAIAGTSNFTSGDMFVDVSGGLGIAPQKNVLWDDLTVFEHIKIFNQLKTPSHPASDDEIHALIDAVGLKTKTKAISKTLSGGQKRKLQLGMMLTGDSAICCVDEVSSGIDPLSRRKIWDILLSERGKRTIVMTTHFLDEADLLADQIAVLSKGKLRAEGSSAQLKDTYGAGYRVHVLNARDVLNKAPEVQGVQRTMASNTITYLAPSSDLAAQVIRVLEQRGIAYKLSGPTIEDVFLNLAEEVRDEGLIDDDISMARDRSSDSTYGGKGHDAQSLDLLQGKTVSMAHQFVVFLRKRFTILKTNWIPYAAVFLIPIVATAIIQLLVHDVTAAGCAPQAQSSDISNDQYDELLSHPFLVAGPSAAFTSAVTGLGNVFGQGSSSSSAPPKISDSEITIGNTTIKLTNTYNDWTAALESNKRDLMPGGIWLGDSSSDPTFAYRANNYSSIETSTVAQGLLDSLLTNTPITATYKAFAAGIPPNTGSGLQLIIYFAVACSVLPGLLAMYPNTERRQNVRALQYSSGARALPLWAAHLVFDMSFIVVAMGIVVAILAGTSAAAFYHIGYIYPILVFWGSASISIGYTLSLICPTTLSTYAMSAVISGLGFAVYIISYLFILTLSDPTLTDNNILIANWVISIFFPTGSLIRAFMVATNVFSTTCTGFELQSNPGALTAYGGPILYLIALTIFWFSLTVWIDSSDGKYQSGKPQPSEEHDDEELAAEKARVENPGEDAKGLRVVHLTKAFNKSTAVDNVTFGVDHGEVFALLGPNGAGKSTTISLIRGDLAPSKRGGDVFIENASITKQRPQARANLGVCPQFDAIDSMTVEEHLCHYARLRGIQDVHHQVQAVIRAVGLQAYRSVMAHTLSGGNKRKLSLAIALTGNPSVILLDEPSSGLDAAAKRIMWRTLQTLVPGRSILLTTHSMEEADALATRAGIMARRMLALGTTENLCQRFGDTLHVHLVAQSAPHSTPQEMDRVRRWLEAKFPGAKIEHETYHGQMRFSIPASSVPAAADSDEKGIKKTDSEGSAIGRLLMILEEHKHELGIAHHSVSPTTLNEVFLAIVSKHDVQEEGYGTEKKKPWYKKSMF